MRQPRGGGAAGIRFWVRIAPSVRDASVSDVLGTEARIGTSPRGGGD
jgi:hypothetical protein